MDRIPSSPAPAGYRYMVLGETIEEADRCIWEGRLIESACQGEAIEAVDVGSYVRPLPSGEAGPTEIEIAKILLKPEGLVKANDFEGSVKALTPEEAEKLVAAHREACCDFEFERINGTTLQEERACQIKMDEVGACLIAHLTGGKG